MPTYSGPFAQLDPADDVQARRLLPASLHALQVWVELQFRRSQRFLRRCQRAGIRADYYQTGDTRDRDLWREYSRVTRGLAAVRWSRGLRALMLGPGAEPERGEEEKAADDVDGDLVAAIPLPVSERIRLDGLEHAVLVVAERGGATEVASLLAQSRIYFGTRPA